MMYLLETPNYYKIGYADDIDKRMKSYNTHNPEYALIDQFKGSEFTEKVVHRFLRKILPYKGEWYEKSDLIIPLWEFIKELVTAWEDKLEDQNKTTLNHWKETNELRDTIHKQEHLIELLEERYSNMHKIYNAAAEKLDLIKLTSNE